ncbi:hypothetical protein ABU952_18680 [Bacillus amyloliquefaciens]|uniref:hypothetical protein n=1 Tax=Bacillus amyloliquefaciens TaxID=1390 RepID=UPI00336B68A8
MPASLGDGSTDDEEQQLKKRSQIRKTCQVARATWQPVGGAKLTGREVGRSVPASLGGGSTGGEELQLKERGQIRKTGQRPGQRRRSVPASLGDGSTGGEELQLKERGQIRKTGQAAGATQAIGARIPGRWRHRQRRTAAEGARPDPEDRSGGRGNAGDRCPHLWAIAAPAAKNCI